MSAFRLTAKQQKFANNIIAGLDPSEAYRAAGYKCDKLSPKAISVEAQRVKKNPSVALAIERGQQKATERAVNVAAFTKEKALLWAEQDRRLAHQLGQSGAAVSATRLASDLSGLIIDKKQIEVRRVEDMSDDEIDEQLAELKAERDRFSTTH